jgi:hypothetical protein
MTRFFHARRLQETLMSRRTPWIVAGIVVMAIAAPVVIAGTALLVLFGSDGRLPTGPHVVATPGRALVSSVAEIDSASELSSVLGDNRVEIAGTARSADHGVFVGIAPAAAVDRYLAGADVDVVTDFELDPFTLNTDRRPGTATVAAPQTQDFWVAKAQAASGTASLSWTVRDGDYRFVVMNADASPGVDVDASFAVVLPPAAAIGTTALVSGLVLGAIGIALLVVGLLRPGRPAPAVGSPRGPVDAASVPAQPGARETPPAGHESRPGVSGHRR